MVIGINAPLTRETVAKYCAKKRNDSIKPLADGNQFIYKFNYIHLV
jgi:hypothetical protein